MLFIDRGQSAGQPFKDGEVEKDVLVIGNTRPGEEDSLAPVPPGNRDTWPASPGPGCCAPNPCMGLRSIGPTGALSLAAQPGDGAVQICPGRGAGEVGEETEESTELSQSGSHFSGKNGMRVGLPVTIMNTAVLWVTWKTWKYSVATRGRISAA